MNPTPFQGRPAGPLPGHETGRCVAWDAVALGRETPSGNILVIDDLQDAAAPLTAIMLAAQGRKLQPTRRGASRWAQTRVACGTNWDAFDPDNYGTSRIAPGLR